MLDNESDLDPLPDWTKLPVVSVPFEEAEKRARRQWNEQFDAARETIPERFRWITPIAPPIKGVPFVPPLQWQTRMPWFDKERCWRFYGLWRNRTNLLICGPADAGKTCLMVLHIVWTLEHAAYGASTIKAARESFTRWRPTSRKDLPPIDPSHLSQVDEAKWLRFMFAADLLDDQQRGPCDTKIREACSARSLYVDDIGREMSDAKAGSYLATARSPAMRRVLEVRWANSRRFVGTSEYSANELAEFYGNGSFRRIAGERSGSTVVDLASDEWAGPWLRQRAQMAKR